MRRITVGMMAMGALALLGAPSQAAARSPEAVLEARLALRTYDVEGFGTTDVIGRLGAAAEQALRPEHRREARYLRAVAATDLLVVAARTDDIALRARVAEALGVPDGQIEAHLRAELESLCFGSYGPTAHDAREGLAVLADLRAGRSPDLDREGLRRDALVLGAIRAALDEGRLAEMAEDPCATGSSCPLPDRLFDAETRRAIEALRRAGEAIERLEQAAEHGDPLAFALRDAVTEDRLTLETLEVRGVPRLGGVELPRVSSQVPSRAPDAIVVVSGDSVRWAWVPRVRLDDSRRPVAVAPTGPALPTFERIAVPSDLRPALLPIDGVQRALERIHAAAPGATVAIGAQIDAPGHVLARVLLSVLRVGFEHPVLAGVGSDGSLRGVHLRVQTARDGQHTSADLRVRVRLGGYSLNSPAGFLDIPRIRDAGERLRFDVEALAAGASRAPYDGAAVSFMSAVRAGPLLAAAFAVAPADGPVTLTLP